MKQWTQYQRELESRIDALTADLATERAAREEERKLKENTLGNCMMLVRERDTALARVEEQEIQLQHAAANQGKAVAAAQRAESALASARKAIEAEIAGFEDMLLIKGEHTVVSARACVDDLRDLLKAVTAAAPSPAPCSGCEETAQRVMRECREIDPNFGKPTTFPKK